MNDLKKQLSSELRVLQVNLDQWCEYQLDDSVDWVAEILNELTASQSENMDTLIDKGGETSIKISLRLLRKITSTLKDHIVINGKIIASYNAPCIKCLCPTPIKIDFDFKTAHINAAKQDEAQFEELDEIFLEEAERELYFYEKGIIKLKEILREYLFMGIVPFPIHDESCKGLCKTCGINLNHESCSHQS